MFNVRCLQQCVIFHWIIVFCRIFLRSYFFVVVLFAFSMLVIVGVVGGTPKKRRRRVKKNTKPNKQTIGKKMNAYQRTVYQCIMHMAWFGLACYFVKMCKYIQTVCTWQRELSFFFGSSDKHMKHSSHTEWYWKNKSKCCYRCNGKSLTPHYNKIHYITLALNFYLIIIMQKKQSHLFVRFLTISHW